MRWITAALLFAFLSQFVDLPAPKAATEPPPPPPTTNGTSNGSQGDSGMTIDPSGGPRP